MSSPHTDDHPFPHLAASCDAHSAAEQARRPGRPLAVVVQNLAGHRLDDHVCRGERLHAVAADAVHRFVVRGELTAGCYLVTLPRLDGAELDPTSTVAEAGIVDGDTLVLISAAPQIDGTSVPGAASVRTTDGGPGRAAR